MASTRSSACLMRVRYLSPCRSPYDSASAPMFAASQKCPSGLASFSATASVAAASPVSSHIRRSAAGPCVPRK